MTLAEEAKLLLLNQYCFDCEHFVYTTESDGDGKVEFTAVGCMKHATEDDPMGIDVPYTHNKPNDCDYFK